MREKTIELLEFCRERTLTIAVAESLTGGLVASSIVDIPGASDVFLLGVVAYQPFQKEKILGVARETIADYGVVSSQTAQEMVAGVKSLSGAFCSVSTTGVAGPDKSEGKPAGTVYLGCSVGNKVFTTRLALSGSRDQIRKASSEQAIDFLLTSLKSVVE